MKTKYRYPSLPILISMSFLGGVGETIFAVALVSLTTYYGISNTQAQLAIILYLLFFALSQPFQGMISDVLGRRKVYIWGTLLYILGSLICFQSKMFYVFLFGRMLQGVGGGTGSVLVRAIVKDHPDIETQKKLMPLIIAILGFYPLIGPLIGGFIVHHSQWKFIFLYLALLGIGFLLINLVCLPETFEKDMEKKFTLKVFIQDSYIVLTNIQFLIYLVFGGLLNSIPLIFVCSMPFIFIKELHYTPIEYGYILTLSSICYIIGALLIRLLSKIPVHKITSMSFLITSACGLSLIFYNNLYPNYNYVIVIIMCFCSFATSIAKSIISVHALMPFKDQVGLSSAYLGMLQMLIVNCVILTIHLLPSVNLLYIAFIIFSISIICLFSSLLVRRLI